MSSFLDSLANSWSGGYDVNEIERRRAMNNALMNLGTTLLMAGGSGSWRAAAPMLAQAVPSAMGAFQGSIQDAQKLRMMEEERAWQKEQREYTMAERKRIEDEREDRKRKEGLDTQAASKQAEMLQSRLEEIYERGVNDEDISALPDGTKPDLEAFWNAGRTALESFYLTNDKSYLEPLETAVAQFGGQVNRSEDDARRREKEALDAGFKSFADKQAAVGLQKQNQAESAAATAEARRAATAQRQAEADAAEEFANIVASGDTSSLREHPDYPGIVILPSGAIYRVPSTTMTARRGDDAASAKVEKEIKGILGLDPATKGAPMQLRATQAILAGGDDAKPGSRAWSMVVPGLAASLGQPAPTTTEEAQALIREALDPARKQAGGAYRQPQQAPQASQVDSRVSPEEWMTILQAEAMASAAGLKFDKEAAIQRIISKRQGK